MAGNRRSRTAGKIVLGCGLLFYGLRLLRTGFTPLFADPQVLPYLASLSGETLTGVLTCAATGAFLCAVFQGPGPVYALVLSLAATDGLINVSDGLAVLCGTAVGSGLGTVVLGWPYGKRPRTLAAGHALLGMVMTVTMMLTLPLWTALARQVVGTDPTELAYGAKTLFPNVRAHLTLGFLAAQLSATVLCLAGVAVAIRVGKRLAQSSEQALARARRARESSPPRPASLSLALGHCREALDALRDLRRSQEREPTVIAERAVREASLAIEVLLESREPSLPGANVGAASMSAQHLLGAVHGAVRVAEQALERDDRLLEGDEQTLESMHARIEQGLDAILVALQNHTPLSAEAAQAREISLNASEADARRQLLGNRPHEQDSARYRLWLSELFVAYEAIGNHLYRLHMALASDVDDDLG
jgi:phosphate:Na+ symporter